MELKDDIFRLLRRDHLAVAEIFQALDDASPEDSDLRLQLFSRLRAELKIHAQAEEAAVYPLLKTEHATKSLAHEYVEAHDDVDQLLHEMDAFRAGDERWEETLQVLRDRVEHHVDEEEAEMFARLREHFTELELDEAAGQFARAKERFLRDVRTAA